MPNQPDDDIETRVRGLERAVDHLRDEVGTSRTDATAARVLAGGADRDVSEFRVELRAHKQVLHALRETQLEMLESQREMQESQREMRETLLLHGTWIAALETEMRAGFATMGAGMAQITLLLQGIADPGQD